MIPHLRFWWWALRVALCGRLPGAMCWIHGGVVYRAGLLPDDDPCWRRAGWRKDPS